MTDQPQQPSKDEQIRANQTIRLSPEELKALMAQAGQAQAQPQPEKNPWDD
jgi:hypothetical protein